MCVPRSLGLIFAQPGTKKSFVFFSFSKKKKLPPRGGGRPSHPLHYPYPAPVYLLSLHFLPIFWPPPLFNSCAIKSPFFSLPGPMPMTWPRPLSLEPSRPDPALLLSFRLFRPLPGRTVIPAQHFLINLKLLFSLTALFLAA